MMYFGKDQDIPRPSFPINTNIIHQKQQQQQIQKKNPTSMQANNPNLQKFHSISKQPPPQVSALITQYYNPDYQGLYLTACFRFMEVLEHQDWKQLQVLWLRYCQACAIDIKKISVSKWPNLMILSLNVNNIGSAGAKYLIKANLPQLETLELVSCFIGNQGAKYLSKGIWPNLRKLDLRSNMIKNQIFSTLPQIDWKQITTVNTEHQVSDQIALLNLCVLEAGQDIDVPFVLRNEKMFLDVIRTVRTKFPLFYTKWL